MPQIYISGRQFGKTTMLIKESARTGATIAVANYQMAQYVQFMAINMGLKIPEPVTYAEIFDNFRRKGKTRYLIDELQMMLEQLNIDTATLGYQVGYSPRVYILDERHKVTPLSLKGENDSKRTLNSDELEYLKGKIREMEMEDFKQSQMEKVAKVVKEGNDGK